MSALQGGYADSSVRGRSSGAGSLSMRRFARLPDRALHRDQVQAMQTA